MSTKILAVIALSCLGLAACATNGQPGAANAQAMQAVPPTASNGGGQRALGNIPSLGMNSATGATNGPVPSSKGNAY